MDQERLDDLEKRVEQIEDGNGWHESAKYVLDKLDVLTDAIKEQKTETCRKIDKMQADNSASHKLIHDKLDAQKTFCAQRPLQCSANFLPSKTFNWLLIVLIVLFGASFSLSGTALKQNSDHGKAHVALEKVVEDHVKDITPEKIHDIEDKIHDLHQLEEN